VSLPWDCGVVRVSLETDGSAEKTASSQSEAIDIKVRPFARSSCRKAALYWKQGQR
jgi:hypothetical protein